MALEQPRYEVLTSEEPFEIRQYEPYLVAETWVQRDFEAAGNEGFRRLAGYIFGNNRSRHELQTKAPVSQYTSEKIAMTAPVNMHLDGNHYRMTFMMPSGYTLETLPEPVDPEVRLRQVPAERMAVIRYSGTWNRRRYLEHRSKLESWVTEKGLTPVGEPVFARYDPPFKPWFLRRNEILIPLEDEATP